ncbi:MAG TPA: DUF1731 domain-containing protein, partial [Prolixibacteraceae bacterium]|nr:DUF1731 domain-containing protein [Prolixibacteraceae bacterium]
GGMLKTILPVFKSGLGGYLGSGKQMTSFIHIDDLRSAFRFFIDNEKTTGTYNLVSPNPVTNKEFTWSFAKKLHRPVWFHIPEAALFLIFGKASSVLLNGSNVLPKRLTEEGFTFQYPTIQQTFDQLFD